MVTEFGAEANRDGPPEDKGSYAYQQDFVNYHLGVYNSEAWLSGAVYWALNEFKVAPGVGRRQPAPAAAALHQKGLLRYGDLSRKPAWEDLRRGYTPSSRRPGRRRLARADRPALRRRLAGRAAHAARPEVGEPLVGAQPHLGRNRVGQRHAAGRRGLGPAGTRSLPPPPSSSSGGLNPCWDSERRKSTKSPTPSATAITAACRR